MAANGRAPFEATPLRRMSRRRFLVLAGGTSAAALAGYVGARFLFAPSVTVRPSLPSSLKGVVVIGGGVSGLTAAVDLLDAGVDVRVLEADVRPGGRVRSRHWSNGQVTDMGAEDILNLDHVLWKRIVAYGLPAEQLTPALDAYYVRDTYISPPTGNEGDFILQIDAVPWTEPAAKDSYWDFVAHVIQKDFVPPYGSPEDLAFDVPTYSQYIADQGVHPDVDWFTGVNMKAELCALNDEVNALLGLDTYFYYYYARWYHIRGGNEQIPLAMASRLGDRVFTGIRVTEVRQTAADVRIAYVQDGETREIRSDACVVTVQAPVVPEIVPELPAEKAAALGAVRYGSYVLPQMRFSRRFWNLDYGLKTWSVNTDLATNYFVDQTYTQPGTDGILVGWIAAADAARWYSPDHPGFAGDVTGDAKDRVIDRALSDLEPLYPRARDYLVESYVTQWKRALPYFPPGYLAKLSPLRAPMERIFFAGDYTEGPGMDTAILSGERAAQQVLASGTVGAVRSIAAGSL